MCGIGACWIFVMSGACGKKYSAGGVCGILRGVKKVMKR